MGRCADKLDKKSILKYMKHFFPFILLLFVPFLAKSQTYYLGNVCNDYFPFNPFENEFSNLFKLLNADPHSGNKTIQKRTDSTLFLFKSVYTNYPKLNTRVLRVEIKLQEAEVVLSDSLHVKDTLIQYQLTCYFDGGTKGLQTVKKAFDNFDREYKNHFSTSSSSKIKDDDKDSGIIKNYFISLSPISPLSIAWTSIDENESAFVILLRLKLKQNTLDTYKFSDVKYPH